MTADVMIASPGVLKEAEFCRWQWFCFLINASDFSQNFIFIIFSKFQNLFILHKHYILALWYKIYSLKSWWFLLNSNSRKTPRKHTKLLNNPSPIYPILQRDVEGKAESQDENHKNHNDSDQGSQNLQEHHHINAEAFESEKVWCRSDFVELVLCKGNYDVCGSLK